MKRASQSELPFSPDFKKRITHGGEMRHGKRKLARPVSPKQAMHLVFRSSKATAALSLLHPDHHKNVRDKVSELANRFGVRIYQYANSGNHLHLLIRGRTRKGIQDFLRAVGCRVAQIVTGARKGKAFGRFWDELVFSRVVSGGRDFIETRFYVLQNELEAEGWVDHVRFTRGRKRIGVPEFPPEWGWVG
jgi:putative transposase